MDETRPEPDTLVATLAERSGVGADQVRAVLQAQAELACEHARAGYAIPGLGFLIAHANPPRKLLMQFGPKKGQEIDIPAKTRLKFRVSKIAKDIVIGRNPRVMPDVFTLDWYPADEEVTD